VVVVVVAVEVAVVVSRKPKEVLRQKGEGSLYGVLVHYTKLLRRKRCRLYRRIRGTVRSPLDCQRPWHDFHVLEFQRFKMTRAEVEL